MKAIKSIYVAGKMHDAEWRYELFDEYESLDTDHAHQLGYSPLTVGSSTQWPDYSHVTVCGLRYTGPFFVDVYGGHGYGFFDGDKHGGNIESPYDNYRQALEYEKKKSQVQAWCFSAIARADILFAWIDTLDCYGTIAEIGYAKALGKTVWIAGPEEYDDLWFIYKMADRVRSTREPRAILKILLSEHEHGCLTFRSPIEQTFWDRWIEFTQDTPRFQLAPQYSLGKYHIDFAHVETCTAIELDGFASHSSTEDIANDRRRQRWIERQGWHVVRFGGKEIHGNVDSCVKEVCELLQKRLQPLS